MQSIMEHRFNADDSFNLRHATGRVEHGGINIDGQQMNYSLWKGSLIVNTPGQIGGTVDIDALHYAHGDVVGETIGLYGTGVGRQEDEGVEPFRVFGTFHVSAWGIAIQNVIPLMHDDLGQVVVRPNYVGNVPQALLNHTLAASFENAPVIDITSTKTYSAGNVKLIQLCSTVSRGLVQTSIDMNVYGCITGDTTANWSMQYPLGTSIVNLAGDIVNTGANTTSAPVYDRTIVYPAGAFVTYGGKTWVSTVTRNYSQVPGQPTVTLDPTPNWTSTDMFAAGPACVPFTITGTGVFPDGKTMASISSAQDNFELFQVTSSGSVLTGCFQNPHKAGEMITFGAGVGYGISMRADDKPVKSVFDIGPNDTTLRLVFPILGVFDGNVILTTMNPFTQSNTLPTRAFAATVAVQYPVFDGAEFDSTGGVTRFTSTATNPNGNTQASGYLTGCGLSSCYYGGASTLPPPPLVLDPSTTCTVLPTAHFESTRSGPGWTPVVDMPGSGCTHAALVTPSTVYPNPYAIYPMAIARSNRDPSFVPDPNQAPETTLITPTTPSTAGYMQLGQALLQGEGTALNLYGFEKGDDIEGTYSGHQLMGSQITHSRFNPFPGTMGSIVKFNFRGVAQGDGLIQISNYESPATYYRTATNHFSPGACFTNPTTGLDCTAAGDGNSAPPVGIRFSGPTSSAFLFDAPPRGLPGVDTGALLDVGCIDSDNPCSLEAVMKF